MIIRFSKHCPFSSVASAEPSLTLKKNGIFAFHQVAASQRCIKLKIFQVFCSNFSPCILTILLSRSLSLSLLLNLLLFMYLINGRELVLNCRENSRCMRGKQDSAHWTCPSSMCSVEQVKRATLYTQQYMRRGPFHTFS